MFLPDMESAHVFGCEVPSGILDHWRSDGKHHVIGLVELYGAVLALRYWRKYLDDRRVILLLDSWPVLDTLVKGDANVAMWREVLMVLENPLLTVGGLGSFVWTILRAVHRSRSWSSRTCKSRLRSALFQSCC